MTEKKFEELTTEEAFALMETPEGQEEAKAFIAETGLAKNIEKLISEYPLEGIAAALKALAEMPEEEQHRICEEAFEKYKERSAERTIDKIKPLESIIPTNHDILNTKLSLHMTEWAVKNGGTEIELCVDVSGKKEKPLTTHCIITYDTRNISLLETVLTYFDRLVYDAVCSLYDAGNKKMTDEMIYRAMNGMKGTEKPPKTGIYRIKNSLEKMYCIKARIMCKDEFERHHHKEKEKVGLLAQTHGLLIFTSDTLSAGGNIIEAYNFLEEPVLLTYSNATGKTLKIPMELLNIKRIGKNGEITTRSIQNTYTRSVIREQLLRRIELMKGNKAGKNKMTSDRIALSKLYEIAGQTNGNRTEQQRIRDYIEQALKFWAKKGYIQKFEPYKQGQKIAGYKIFV